MLTIKEFLDKLKPNDPSWYKILSGHALIGSQPIEYVSVCEYPAENFIRKNELILSGLITRENDDIFLEFVQDLVSAGASMLIISHPEGRFQLPDNAMHYLKAHPFPIISIPWEYRYADIVQFVLDLLNADIISENSQYELIQRRLLEAYLRDLDLERAVEILSDSFHCPVVFFDMNGNCKAYSHHLNRVGQDEIKNMLNEDVFTISVKTNERLYGNVCFFPSGKRELPKESLFVNHLCWPLTLWVEKGRIIQIVQQGLRDNFIWKITKSPITDFDVCYEEGKQLGFYLGGPYTCVVGDIHLSDTSANSTRDAWIASNINLLKEEVLQTARRDGWRVMVTYQQESLIIYLQSIHEINTVHSFLDELELSLQTVFPNIWFVWGISDPGGNPTDFHKCFQNAKLAQELCPIRPNESTRFVFKDTIINSVISTLRAETSLCETLMNIITPLLAYDEKSKSDLLKTLQCYLDCKNYSETARRMFLHRHSLLYRIDKISELCGVSFQDPDDFLILELCVRLCLNSPPDVKHPSKRPAS